MREPRWHTLPTLLAVSWALAGPALVSAEGPAAPPDLRALTEKGTFFAVVRASDDSYWGFDAPDDVRGVEGARLTLKKGWSYRVTFDKPPAGDAADAIVALLRNDRLLQEAAVRGAPGVMGTGGSGEGWMSSGGLSAASRALKSDATIDVVELVQGRLPDVEATLVQVAGGSVKYGLMGRVGGANLSLTLKRPAKKKYQTLYVRPLIQLEGTEAIPADVRAPFEEELGLRLSRAGAVVRDREAPAEEGALELRLTLLGLMSETRLGMGAQFVHYCYTVRDPLDGQVLQRSSVFRHIGDKREKDARAAAELFWLPKSY